jgi:hypothetical protein
MSFTIIVMKDFFYNYDICNYNHENMASRLLF